MNIANIRSQFNKWVPFLPRQFAEGCKLARCVWLSEEQSDGDGPNGKWYPNTDLWHKLYAPQEWSDKPFLRMPFRNTLLYCEKGKMPPFCHWITTYPDVIESLHWCVTDDFAVFRRGENFIPMPRKDGIGMKFDLGECFGLHGGKKFSVPDDEQWRVKADMIQNFSFYTRIAYYFAYPANAVVQVTPRKTGKSVEWVKSREHFIIIGQEAKESVVWYAVAGRKLPTTLIRGAHPRIGHERTLSSPKFTRKQGLTIWIRDTWVGPREWESEDGGTIYKIYEPEE